VVSPFNYLWSTHNITGLPVVRKMMMDMYKWIHKQNEPQK